jgi:hypothetical protein
MPTVPDTSKRSPASAAVSSPTPRNSLRLRFGGCGRRLELVEGGRRLLDDRTRHLVRQAVPNDVALALRDDGAELAQDPEVLARRGAIRPMTRARSPAASVVSRSARTILMRVGSQRASSSARIRFSFRGVSICCSAVISATGSIGLGVRFGIRPCSYRSAVQLE